MKVKVKNSHLKKPFYFSSMNKYTFLIGYLIFTLLLFIRPAYAQTSNTVPDQHIIMLNPQSHIEDFIQDVSRSFDVQFKKTLSTRLNIHLIEIQTKAGISSLDIQKNIYLHPEVRLSQLNHYVVHRKRAQLIPNDTLFQEQWALNNTGQLNGLEDADIDAPEAWEITTGGISIHNDPIVIAVIDEGFDIAHPDVPWWKNRSEIPGNGIDDDQNGFTDDVDGWNTVTGDGNIIKRLHGTHVSGIAAANGNNRLGVSGVSWNTQVMPIVGFNLDDNGLNTEALVVEAYAYVYEMRYLYNQTRGQRGAFIVATNTSFGLERGRPENSPVWCAMYDSLGTLGILNAVATTNATRNVDVEGDIPSNCPSDYLLVTTQTDRNDEKIGGSFEGGTGPINVDLAAPGEEILSTGIDEQYTILSGTSMAAPHVAGVISLTYSALCNNLLAQYKNNPSTIALQLRQIILDQVDPVDTLQNLIASGGRLNAYQTLLAIDSLCQTITNDCGLTYFLNASSITDSSALISWELINEATSYSVRFRPLSDTDTIWKTISSLNNEITLDSLKRCTTYEFQVSTVCANNISNFTESFIFSTEGCCEPPSGVEVNNIAEGISEITWNEVFGFDLFEVDLRLADEEVWTTFSTTNTTLLLDNLLSCTLYEYRIRTICDTLDGAYSPVNTFRTLDCGLCVEGDYCEIRGENSLSVGGSEWIDRIRIGPINNESGNDDGYGNFVLEEEARLALGQPYAIELTPGFSQDAFEEYWLIWIDLNQNGTFDEPEEIVFDPGGTSAQSIIDTLIIPTDALEGTTRLRVAMRFLEAPPVCGDYLNGEAEDYCIELFIDSTLCLPPNRWAADALDEQSFAVAIEDFFNADSFVMRYRSLDRDSWINVSLPANTDSIAIDGLLPCTGYAVQLAKICNGDTSIFSPTQRILTKGCGTCTDVAYCPSRAVSSRDEWIQRVAINEKAFTSGNDGGYGDHTFFQFSMTPGIGYELNLRPGFNLEPFAEQWSVWIDWNQDGEFDEATEWVFSTPTGTTRPVTDSIFVPSDIPLGSTRMRVSMQFGDLPQPCQELEFGEVEDYCINITTLSSNPSILNNRILLYPNPFTDRLQVEFKDRIVQFRVIDLMGKSIANIHDSKTRKLEISTIDWPSGTYIIQVKTEQGAWVGKAWKP